jgi:hypothetical protein
VCACRLKAGLLLPLDAQTPPLLYARRRPPWGLSGERRFSPPSHHRTSYPTPPWDPVGAFPVARCPNSPQPRRKSLPPRLAPATTAELPRRPPLRPNPDTHGLPGDLVDLPSPSPTGPAAGPAGIWPEPRRPPAQGPHCEPPFFPRAYPQSKGTSVRKQKPPGSLLQNDS